MESSKLHGWAREDLTLPGRVWSGLPFAYVATQAKSALLLGTSLWLASWTKPLKALHSPTAQPIPGCCGPSLGAVATRWGEWRLQARQRCAQGCHSEGPVAVRGLNLGKLA